METSVRERVFTSLLPVSSCYVKATAIGEGKSERHGAQAGGQR
jgi:hypothetical protein